MTNIIFCFLALFATRTMCNELSTPHIVFITVEDFGWDDISLHGSDFIYTPNIDVLGIQGIKIHNYYTDCQGTPSMSALFTGKYPMTMGTQGSSIGAGEDRGVPTSERLLPSILKDFGYVTHLVGKWNLGKSRECYLPTNRGFDTFYGTTSDVDYFSRYHLKDINGTAYFGYDFFENLIPVRDENSNKHLTDLLTDRALKLIEEHDTSNPMYLHIAHAAAHVGGGSMQAATEDFVANNHIAHPSRRNYAGSVTGVDRSVGKIVSALAEKDILNNTLLIFVSGNGAKPTGDFSNFGSNSPLRGSKSTPWEGAVRSIAIAWHADVIPKLWKGLFHVTDWVPTIIGAIKGETNKNETENLDGVNQWSSIINNEDTKRNGTVIAVDDLNEWGAFRDGDIKIVIGNIPDTFNYGQDLNKIIADVNRPTYEEQFMNSTTAQTFNENLKIEFDIGFVLDKRDSCNINKQINRLNNTADSRQCTPTKIKGCMFNISADPAETQDLWDEYPDIVQQLSVRFRSQWPKLVPRLPVTFDPKADPQNSNFIWRPWVNNDEEIPSTNVSHRFPLEMSEKEMQYFLKLNIDAMSERLASYMQSMADTLVTSMSNIFGSSNTE